MSAPQKHGLLQVPSFKIDGTAFSWKGRPPHPAQAADLPLLWNRDNLEAANDGNALTFSVGDKGRILPGRLIRPPKTLLGASGLLWLQLTSQYAESLDRVGLHIAGPRIQASGATGMTGFLPVRGGNPAPPAEYLGGDLFYIGGLDVGVHYEGFSSAYTNNIPYDIYSIGLNPSGPFYKQWHVTGSQTLLQTINYFSGAAALPGLAADVNVAARGLDRFHKTKMVLAVQKFFTTYSDVVSIAPFFYTGPEPLPAVPHGKFILYDDGANFGDEPGITYLFRVYATTGLAPVNDKPGWDAVFALADGAASQIGHGCSAERYDEDVDIKADVVSFFGL